MNAGPGDPGPGSTTLWHGSGVLPELCTLRAALRIRQGRGGDSGPHPQDAKALLCWDKQAEWSPERLQSDPACCPWQLHSWKRDQGGARCVAQRTRVQGHTRRPRVQEQSLKQPKCLEG